MLQNSTRIHRSYRKWNGKNICACPYNYPWVRQADKSLKQSWETQLKVNQLVGNDLQLSLKLFRNLRKTYKKTLEELFKLKSRLKFFRIKGSKRLIAEREWKEKTYEYANQEQSKISSVHLIETQSYWWKVKTCEVELRNTINQRKTQ